MKRILLMFSFSLCLTNIGAFTADDQAVTRGISLLAKTSDRSETINMIKRSKGFVYGEATMLTKEDAYELAQEILQRNIEDWALAHSKKKVNKVVATDVRELVDSIVLQRANMVRVFLYVKKSNLIPVYKKAGLVIVDTDASQTVELEKPVKRPATDSGQIVSPAKEDVKKLIIGQKDDGLDSLLTQTYTVEGADSISLKTEKSDSTSRSEKELTENEKSVCSEVKPLKSFFRIRDVLVPLKEKGLITEYGKYATLKNPEDAFLIIYDSNGRIQALLGKGTEKRKNLNTGKEDSIRNYPDCGAIWFKVKQ